MKKILILTMIVFFVLQSCSDDSGKEKTDDEILPDDPGQDPELIYWRM